MSSSNAIASSVLQAAEDLRPELSERRREIDELRQLPQDLANRLAALGFYRLVVPESLGGLGVSPTTFCKVMRNPRQSQRFDRLVHLHWRNLAILVWRPARDTAKAHAGKPQRHHQWCLRGQRHRDGMTNVTVSQDT